MKRGQFKFSFERIGQAQVQETGQLKGINRTLQTIPNMLHMQEVEVMQNRALCDKQKKNNATCRLWTRIRDMA